MNPDIIAYQNYQDVVAGRKSHYFTSKIDRSIHPKYKDRKPDCCSYDVNFYNIDKKNKTDENFMIKAAFMTK